jgi:hypothetical protein
MENNIFNQKLSLFEETILDNYLHINIGEYLLINDNINLMISSKKILNNKLNREYFRYVTKIVSKKIILRFITKIYHFKKMINEDLFEILLDSNRLTKRFIALYYFKYYDNKYVESWYNFEIEWKREIIDKYKSKITDKPTKFDLFNLVKKIPVNDTFSIGW